MIQTSQPASIINSPRYVQALAVLLALLPLGALLAAFASYAVDLPIWDEWWAVVPLLQKYFSGTLHVSDVWAQHNEHRLVFPKLLMLGLAGISGYDVRWEMAASIVFALLLYGCLGLHLWLNRRTLGMERSWYWLWVLTAYAVFSLRQHENWFWGFQVQWYMNVFGAALGALILANRKLTPYTFAALIGCGVFSLFSLSAGALYWCLVPVFLLLSHWRACRIPRIWWYLALWCVLFGVLMYVYFLDMKRGNYPGGLLRFFDAPGDSATYVLLYLAGLLTEIGRTDGLSLTVGAMGLAVFVTGGLVTLWRTDAARCRASLFFLFLGCYAIGCALVTGIGRSGFGVEQASSSRYTTISMLLWIADLCMLYESLSRNTFRLWRQKALGAATALLLCACFGLICYRGYASLPYIRYASNVYGQARHALKYHPDPRILQQTCNSAEFILKQARPVLEKYRLSAFRPGG